ncbi:hypothetical protein E2C01_024449 [Portunus trituberculatus]|uniref:Uncharacterized protein n=1 Tax=Portunus trituberculatus TaxID=210409 RepID=A0A5B7ECC5_PORTR|nr:hypothetical protein [Portunus trituberculatus]
MLGTAAAGLLLAAMAVLVVEVVVVVMKLVLLAVAPKLCWDAGVQFWAQLLTVELTVLVPPAPGALGVEVREVAHALALLWNPGGEPAQTKL